MKKTAFYSCHKAAGAKLVPFAGYEMPIQYTSIMKEHKAVRESVGVFDVSHMGEVFVTGEKAAEFVQEITVNDVTKLFPGRVQYSAMCYPEGGIVDDLLVYKVSDTEYLLVINASNIEKDFAWMQQNNTFGVTLENKSDDYSLLAVQGPNSRKVVEKVLGIEVPFDYYHFIKTMYKGFEIIVSRTGYTGELGYEIYLPCDVPSAESFWAEVFEAGAEFGIVPIGLAARDTLRLEMGYCLYGNDIDQTTNPLEAGLGWITKMKKERFIGKDALTAVQAAGLKRKLVPITTGEKVIPRHGYDIAAEGRIIGQVASGTMSPVLEHGIAMGYVEKEYAAPGTKLSIVIRGKEAPAEVTTLPFVNKK